MRRRAFSSTPKSAADGSRIDRQLRHGALAFRSASRASARRWRRGPASCGAASRRTPSPSPSRAASFVGGHVVVGDGVDAVDRADGRADAAVDAAVGLDDVRAVAGREVLDRLGRTDAAAPTAVDACLRGRSRRRPCVSPVLTCRSKLPPSRARRSRALISSAKNSFSSSLCWPLSRARKPLGQRVDAQRLRLFLGLSSVSCLHEEVADRRVRHFVGPVVVVAVRHQLVADLLARRRTSPGTASARRLRARRWSSRG